MRNERVVASHVTVAGDSESRRKGLLGRATFDDGHAMIIAPSNAVHTFFMKFAIDIVFARRDGQVVKTLSTVKPWRLAGALRGYAVIELPAGTLARCDTRAGDTLALVATLSQS
jgi:hypothetical protein